LQISPIICIIAVGFNPLTDNLNTKDFIKALAEKLDVSQKEAENLLQQTTQVFREAVSEEKKLTVLHLGSFQVKKSDSRSAYIPALNKKALVPPKRMVQFQAADSLKDKLKSPGKP
jgi:DNA-binding protein HU-beta